MKIARNINYLNKQDITRVITACAEQHKINNKLSNVYVLDNDEKRRLSQNKYYWAMMQILVDELGEDKNYYHKFFKARFIPKETITVKGFKQESEGSTTDFDTKRMAEYIENIRQFSLNRLNIYLPLPNEVPIEIYLKAIN